MSREKKYCYLLGLIAAFSMLGNVALAIKINVPMGGGVAASVGGDFAGGTDFGDLGNVSQLLCANMDPAQMAACSENLDKGPVSSPALVVAGGNAGGSNGGGVSGESLSSSPVPAIDNGSSNSGGKADIVAVPAVSAENIAVPVAIVADVAANKGGIETQNAAQSTEAGITPDKAKVEIINAATAAPLVAVAAVPVKHKKPSVKKPVVIEKTEVQVEEVMVPVVAAEKAAFDEAKDWQVSSLKDWSNVGSPENNSINFIGNDALAYLGLFLMLSQCLLFSFWIGKKLVV